MSTLITPTTWQWPSDVLAFAEQQGVAGVLEPLRQATLRLFPTGNLKVTLELDPEIRDEWYLVFEVRVPEADVPDFVQAVYAWDAELYPLCPKPLVRLFRIFLEPVAS